MDLRFCWKRPGCASVLFIPYIIVILLISVGMLSELNSSPGNPWLLNLLLCFCGFFSLLFAVAVPSGLDKWLLKSQPVLGPPATICIYHVPLCATAAPLSWELHHLRKLFPITVPSPGTGACLTTSPFHTRSPWSFSAMCCWVGDMDEMEMTRTPLSWWLLLFFADWDTQAV